RAWNSRGSRNSPAPPTAISAPISRRWPRPAMFRWTRPLSARSRRPRSPPPPPAARRLPGMWRPCRKSSPLQEVTNRRSPLRKEADSCEPGPSKLPFHPALSMKILVIGSGGREHALAWKIAASPLVTKLWCAPGNAGIANDAECVGLDITNHPAVIDFCKKNAVEFVVIGPDAQVAAGMVDDLNAAGFKAFGPTRAAARLEGSKNFTK